MSWMKMLFIRGSGGNGMYCRALKEEFCVDTDPLHLYVRLLADWRQNGGRRREPCFFATMQEICPVRGWRTCSETVQAPSRPPLVSARCGRWNLVFEGPPVCPSCRLDARDLRRKDLAAMTEEELWASLLPAHWMTTHRSAGGQPGLLVPPGVFMRQLGIGFALRTLLPPQRMSARMTTPPDSYHVRRRRGRARSSYAQESLLDRIIEGLEER
jgi:hypothetical protein